MACATLGWSCSKFNSIVQKAAVQNYESIWFQFNQLEVPSWPALKLRRSHHNAWDIFFFCLAESSLNFCCPTQSQRISDSWSCEARIQFIQAGYIALRTYPKAKGKEVVTEITVLRTGFLSSIWTYLLFKKKWPLFLYRYLKQIGKWLTFCINIHSIFFPDGKLLERIVYPKSSPALTPDWPLPLITHKSPLTSISKCLMIIP